MKATIGGPDGGRTLDASVSEIQISPLALYVWISGEDLVLHHGPERPGPEDSYYDCHEYQEVAAYDADGQPIVLDWGMKTAAGSSQPGNIVRSGGLGGGCSGYNEREGYLWLAYSFQGLMDVNRVAKVVVNGVEIPIS